MIVLYKRLKRRILNWGLSFILTVASNTMEFPNVAYVTQSKVAQSIEKTSLTEISTGSAHDLFCNAYENRYTWDEQFPACPAEVSVL